MEIKTCEQYVLNRLERAENDVESMKVDVQLKDAQISSLTKELKDIKECLKHVLVKRQDDDGDWLIRMETIFEKFESDKEDFEVLSKILNDTDNFQF